MNLYKKMYNQLFNKITDIIDELQTIQQETEEEFLAQQAEQEPTEEINTDQFSSIAKKQL